MKLQGLEGAFIKLVEAESLSHWLVGSNPSSCWRPGLLASPSLSHQHGYRDKCTLSLPLSLVYLTTWLSALLSPLLEQDLHPETQEPVVPVPLCLSPIGMAVIMPILQVGRRLKMRLFPEQSLWSWVQWGHMHVCCGWGISQWSADFKQGKSAHQPLEGSFTNLPDKLDISTSHPKAANSQVPENTFLG